MIDKKKKRPTKKLASVCFAIVGVIATSSAFAACDVTRYNGSNSVDFVKYGLSMYFKDKSMQMNKPISSDDACLLATEIAATADQELQNFSGSTLYNDTNIVYRHLFAGSYYKGLSTIVSNAIIMKGSPTKEAKSKLNLLWNVVKYQNNKNVDKYNFQLYVVAPYLYNVTNDRDEVNTTQRFGSKGSKVNSCGKLICENEKVSLFDWLLY